MKYNKLFSWVLIPTLTLSLSGCDLISELFLPGAEVEQTTLPTGESIVAEPVNASSASYTVDEDIMTVSSEFELGFAAAQATQIQTVQLNKTKMPEDLSLADFRLERYHADTGIWIPEGFPMSWNANEGSVTFEIANPVRQTAFEAMQSKNYRYRIRVYIFSNIFTVRREDSAFQIHYYPANLGYADSVIKSERWIGSGMASEERIPDFVEDLDLALNQAYTKLLQIKTQSGQALFKKMEEPIDVYIRNTGSAAGNSPLGGPMAISNIQITDWEDLQRVASHELVHVLQGQYYSLGGLFTGRANRWFIEATAEYFTVRTLGLSGTDKRDVYGDLMADYLGVPLNASSDGSMYAAGHFLNWASDDISQTLVADAIANSSANDAVSLSEQIRKQSSYTGLGDALIGYVSWVSTHPEADGGLNSEVRDKLKGFHISEGTWPKVNLVFTNNETYFPLNSQLPTLAFVYGEFIARNDDSALLVMDASKADKNNLRSRSYDRVGTHSSDYTGAKPLESILDLFGSTYLTVPNFGRTAKHAAAEQWVLNDSQTKSARAQIDYYLLRTPEILEQKDGVVSWSTVGVQKIPAELLDSYAVYLNNHLLEEDIPIEKNKAEQSYQNSVIREKGLPVTVTIKDHLGNTWPEMKAEQILFELLNNPFPSGMAAMSPGSSVTLEYRLTGVKNPEIRWALSTMASEGGDLGTIASSPGRVTFTASPSVAGLVNLTGTLVENNTVVFMQMISIIPQLDSLMPTN